MIEQRMQNEEDVFLKLKLPAILIFKLLCHHLHVVQHHWKARGGKFKAVTLCYWALLVLDGFDAEGKHVGISSSLCATRSAPSTGSFGRWLYQLLAIFQLKKRGTSHFLSAS